MLMNFSKGKKGEAAIRAKLKGRTGHRLVRLDDWLFVIGGVDSQGRWVNEVQRINTQNHRIDSLLLDNTICLQGFSIFSYQESIYLWGGISNRSTINQLLQFDGTKFTPHRQKGQLPSPRAYHLSATFGTKYLIVFAGNNEQQFFKDWYLFNIKTFEWRHLIPSTQIGFSSGGSMIWLGGRGVMLLNQVYDKERGIYCKNKFFQFYVSDFTRNNLKVEQIHLDSSYLSQNLIFTDIRPYSSDSFMVFGGYNASNLKDLHKTCLMVDLQTLNVTKIETKMPPISAFQSIFYKNGLYFVGGDDVVTTSSSSYSGIMVQTMKGKQVKFKRHVCQMCRLYFDEQWVQSTRQIYKQRTMRQQLEYGSNMKLDNRVLQSFSSYIRDQLYAFTLLLVCLKTLDVKEIDINIHKIQKNKNAFQCQQSSFVKISCHFQYDVSKILHLISLDRPISLNKEKESNTKELRDIQMAVLRMKIATFRLGKATIFTFKLSKDQVCVLYYSSSQLECTHTNYSTSPCYSYTYNYKKKICSQPIYRSIIHQNLKSVFKSPSIYEDIGDCNMSIICFCSQSMQSQLILLQNSSELDTGQNSLQGKQQYKRSVPMMQLSFLPKSTLPKIYVQNNNLNLFNLQDLLQSDSKNGTLQLIDLISLGITPSKKIFEKIILFNYPEEYWFKRVLVYHKGRLISHFKQGRSRICGIVELDGRVELDLGGTNVCGSRDKLIVQTFLEQLKSLKRDNQL